MLPFVLKPTGSCSRQPVCRRLQFNTGKYVTGTVGRVLISDNILCRDKSPSYVAYFEGALRLLHEGAARNIPLTPEKYVSGAVQPPPYFFVPQPAIGWIVVRGLRV